jgi:hypothetical protein
MTKSIDKDQIALDKKKKQEERKVRVLTERMEFFQKGLRELQAKAQVRMIPVIKVTPQKHEANVELVPESEKTLEECLAEYAFKQNQEKEEAEKAEVDPEA